MNTTRLQVNYLLGILIFAGGSAIAQSSDESLPIDRLSGLSGILGEAASGSIIGATIEELRERSTKTFERLDENQSGSITLNEIDLSKTEEEIAEMSRLELREWRHRSTLITNKFLRYDEETEEFEIVDKNNDGVLNKEEYEVRFATIQNRGVEMGFEEIDIDGNNGVELHEFNAFLDDLEEMDEDGDGTISAVEAKKSGSSMLYRELMVPSQSSFDMIDLFTDQMKAIEKAADAQP